MFNMEFIYQNYINTTTQFSVGAGNTGTLANLFDRNRSTLFSTNGYGSNTAATLTWQTASAFVVSRIAITGHNLKDFRIYHSGVTANTFALTGYNTTTSVWTTNSQTSTYLIVPTTTVTSLSIQMNAAFTADTEKVIAELYIGKEWVTFPMNPDSDSYSPKIIEENVLHKMSDGGTVRYHLGDKFKTSIGLTFLSTAQRTQFKTVYDSFTPFNFVPFPTENNWDGDMYECNWVNGFDFLKLQNNIIGNGYQAEIKLEETPSS